MSFFFFANNLNFAIELLGAVVAFMAAWLTFDTYSVSKEGKILARTLGFGLFALWQIMAAVGAGDLASFFGFGLLVVGLVLILGSFVKHQEMAMPAILVIPSFTAYAAPLYSVEALLLLGIAAASYLQAKREMNPTWRSFFSAFGLLGLGAVFTAIAGGNMASLFSIVAYTLGLVGWLFLFAWIWQFLALRLRESLVIIFISAALFLSTVVTLAFSTILIGQITSQTEASLLTDARVLDLDIRSLEKESLAEATLLAQDPQIVTAIGKNDFQTLQAAAENFMETYGLGFVTITDARGTVLVRAHALSKRGDSLAGERAFEEAQAGSAFATIERSPVEGLSIRAGAPVVQKGRPVGTVIAGYPLDNALVDGMKRVTGLEMFVYEDAASVAATAFAADGRTRLTGVTVSSQAVTNAVLLGGRSVTASADLFGQTFLASYLPLENGDGKVVGMLSSAKPQQDILDIVNATNRLTLLTVIIVMLVLAVPVYLFTRRLTAES